MKNNTVIANRLVPFITAGAFLLLAVLSSCSSTKKTVISPPEAGKSLLVGAILLENNGIEEKFEAKTAKITVVIVGKSIENGEEFSKGYRVRTDENGYFMLQNVPPGAYVLKGIEADVGYETRLLLSCRWEGNAPVYYPVENIINYTVRIWPEVSSGKVIDLGIGYFSIDAAFRVFQKQYPRLESASPILKDKHYSMPPPEEYYRMKYPEWEWFGSEAQGE